MGFKLKLALHYCKGKVLHQSVFEYYFHYFVKFMFLSRFITCSSKRVEKTIKYSQI